MLQKQDKVRWGLCPEWPGNMMQNLHKVYQTIADQDGNWRTTIATGTYGGPYKLTIYSKEENILFNNVLVGEVWICSGQSNMAWTVEQSADPEKEIGIANYPEIRLFSIVGDSKIYGGIQGKWNECSPASVKHFSAVAYHFAREIYEQIHIPIGLVCNAVGGSIIEQWSAPETLDTLQYKLTGGRKNLFQRLMEPIIPYGIKGVIWYQGEFNTHNPIQYRNLFPNMIEDWRRRWGQGDFPFYYVQLPAFGKNKEVLSTKHGWAGLREAQLKTLSVKNTGMAVIIDFEEFNLHPANKREVGQRLALIPLSNLYNKKSSWIAPVYQSFIVKGSDVHLSFTYEDQGFLSGDRKPLSGFIITGEDSVFHLAEARIVGKQIIVSSKYVSRPIAVRYAWGDNPTNNLRSKTGLPVSPFRTDDWILPRKRN